MEKQITFTELKGKYFKDFDTFGKMDPFIQFIVGKSHGKTEVAEDQGKETSWKTSVVLTYYDETVIIVRSYDEDVTQNQYMGEGKIDIKTLKQAGTIQIKIDGEKGENVGIITGKYTVKNLPATPLLIVKNIKCEFNKELKYLLKTKPYVQISADQGSVETEVKENGEGNPVWAQSLRIKTKDNCMVTFKLLDKNDSSATFFVYQAFSREFKQQSGSKKINVLDKNYVPLGTLQFEFETVNFVTKEQSSKTQEKQKKSQKELTSISINTLRGELKKKDQNIYFKIVVGQNVITTQTLKSAPVNFTQEPKATLYAEPKQNRIHFVMYEKNTITDEILASGSILLEGLTGGQKKIELKHSSKPQQVGNIYVSLAVKQVPFKSINISSISVSFTEGGDLFGQSQPYVVAKIGGWSSRTEVGDANRMTFKRNIELKYSSEDQIVFQVWDEDLTTDDLMFTQKVKLSELKNSKGELSIKLTQTEDGKVLNKGKLTFHYDIKSAAPEVSTKGSQKKIPEPVKQQIKKQVPPPQKVQEVKKQELKKQEPKKQEPKKQEVIQQEPKKPQMKKEEPKKEQSQREIKRQIQRKEEPKIMQQKKPSQRQIGKHQKSEVTINKSLDRSKQSLKLPSIMQSINYGDKIFDKQSAATLQRSILVYSVPKASRFANGPKYAGEPSYYVDTCFKPNSQKGAGFGFGTKRQFPEWMQRNMKENPPPGAYFDIHDSQYRAKGPTFGISHKYYEKVTIPKEQKLSSHNVRKLSPIRQIPRK